MRADASSIWIDHSSIIHFQAAAGVWRTAGKSSSLCPRIHAATEPAARQPALSGDAGCFEAGRRLVGASAGMAVIGGRASLCDRLISLYSARASRRASAASVDTSMRSSKSARSARSLVSKTVKISS